MVECPITNKKIHFSEFKQVSLPKVVVNCNHCGTKVSLTPRNLSINGLGYVCSECLNFVAFKFNGHFYQPRTVMNLKWNKDMKRRGIQIGDELVFTECKTKKDNFILRILNMIAKEENLGFLTPNLEVHKGALLIDRKKEKYIGYIFWHWKKFKGESSVKPVLNQIFVVEDERRKGYGTKMIKTWVENIIEGRSFVVEEPGIEALKILVKLGYAEVNGEKVIGKKCSFW